MSAREAGDADGRPYGRADPAAYRSLPLRAHELLEDVPLHDVWFVRLPDVGKGRTLEHVRAFMTPERISSISPAVRALFAVRFRLGSWLGWDSDDGGSASLANRVSSAERNGVVVEPGSSDGPFDLIYSSENEAISEARNRTVHAFLVLAIAPSPPGHLLYWAIYVRPVSRLTSFYMALIDPFRRHLIYPRILRYVRDEWLKLETR